MSQTKFFGAMLATTVAFSTLVGCQSPSPAGPAAPGGSQPGTIAAQPASDKKAASAQNGTELAAAMSEEREAEDYNALADEGAARYAVMMVGGPEAKPGGVAITGAVDLDGKMKGDATGATKAGGKLDIRVKGKLKADVKANLDLRLKALKEKAKVRLAKHKDAGAKIKAELGKAAWVDNGDGTKSKTIEFDLSKTIGAKAVTKHRKMVRTVNEEGVLVSLTAEFSHTGQQGAKHVMTRSKTLQEDGSYKVVFHSEITLGNGNVRTCDWEKTLSAEGKVAGTGTMTWKSATGATIKTVALTCGGTEAAETTTAVEAGATTTVEAPIDGEIEAEVKAADGTTTEIDVVEAEDGTVESTTEVAAEATTTTP